MSTIPITKRGAELLKEELHRLKHVERPSVINAISEARAQGDLSENAEYDAAKEKQGFIEGRIQELESKLSAAQVIDPASLDITGRVVFGATVDLEDLEDGTKFTYQIVGDCIDITIKFKDEATFDAYADVPEHNQLAKMLDDYRSRNYWEAVRTTDPEAALTSLEWDVIDPANY